MAGPHARFSIPAVPGLGIPTWQRSVHLCGRHKLGRHGIESDGAGAGRKLCSKRVLNDDNVLTFGSSGSSDLKHGAAAC
jgi:hypothetical protein